ncbi:conserved hypothetical protein [Talaromyces stipitatus ATCC 10500]|uniref:Transcription factor TFIIIC triple barrel domain-containing protein n=1 Tax=Talaromyces stipitatus (strain ATCC 10500 / CBS 375.48 / QM 6759 / NRRL 1006) TaxID=441959 RepID=B8LT72_TALSN|nr:uncharacterized protein TSTA_069940 [Talaromyces stipitatus ATCC 10500]EED23580.1 conserved hypothetical protein [Talaromyces stipitatus ATCC 10500]
MQVSTPDSEYEYEYDATETETFYVNIDLTSYNGPLRVPRGYASSTTEQPSRPDEDAEEAASPPQDRGEVTGKRKRVDGNESLHDIATDEVEVEDDDQIQIMELHSKNPYISYRNHIFSCEWADMIGTDMHFVRREDSEPDPTYLKHADGYSLIAANPIKIIGRRVHVARSSVTAKPNEKEISSATFAHDNRSSQVRFLQELMDIKREKGETDMVRMTYGSRRNQQFEDRISKWAHTEERVNMIHQLNRAALGGDSEALNKLEELYTQIEQTPD